jgi:hypothetical protein
MNKYLEKIADWRELEPGIHYDDDYGDMAIRPDVRDRINKRLDTSHRRYAALAMGGFGALTPLAVVAGSAFSPNPVKWGSVATMSGVLGALGVAGGYALGHAGNHQYHDHVTRTGTDWRVQDHVHGLAGRPDRTSSADLIRSDEG